MPSNSTELPSESRHRFYIAVALACAMVAAAGFARTYYLTWWLGEPSHFRWQFNQPPVSPPLHFLLYFHGFLLTSWYVLFIVQTGLVATSRVSLHRRLGVFGTCLAAAIVLISFAVVFTTARHQPSNPGALALLGGDSVILTVFGALVTAGIWLRRRSDYHKRFMLMAAVSLLVPALNRIDLEFIHSHGPILIFAVMDLFIFVCVVYDAFRYRRLHPAYVWGGLPIVLGYPLTVHYMFSSTWQRMASWLATGS